jgi:hypothetical protein
VLLTPEVRASLPLDFLTQLQTALAQSLFWVYTLLVVLAIIGFASSFLLPGGRADRHAYKPSAQEEATMGTESMADSLAHIG